MEQNKYIDELIGSCGPTIPIDDLVVELNRLYHSFEAAGYDDSHPEVHDQLPPIWAEMIGSLISHAPEKGWHVLDFGCGTGFEAMQLLEALGPARIQSLTCYDPSPEMLAICRQKIGSRLLPNIRFCETLSEVLQRTGGYDLLTTNSLLHHLPSPVSEIRALDPVIRNEAWWLMGHEPSSRYYRNPECAAELRRYRRRAKLKKLANPQACWRKVQSCCGAGKSTAESTAAAAHKAGLFARKPSALAIMRMVDFNVPHSAAEAAAGRGFDFEEMTWDMASFWRLRWVKTYAFMGRFTRSELNPKWRRRGEHLAMKFPLDGTNFCTVWSRV